MDRTVSHKYKTLLRLIWKLFRRLQQVSTGHELFMPHSRAYKWVSMMMCEEKNIITEFVCYGSLHMGEKYNV